MGFFDTIAVPFAWILRNLYLFTGNYGIALILFTLVIKLILLPFSMKSKKSLMKTSRLAPKAKALEAKYKDDKLKYQTELQKLYKEEGANPMSGCLWSFLPIPILFALYYAIRQPLTHLMNLSSEQIELVKSTLTSIGVTVTETNKTYIEIPLAEYIHDHFAVIKAAVPQVFDIDFSFLGINLSKTPSISFFSQDGFWQQSPGLIWAAIGLFLIPIVSGGLNLLSAWITQKTNNSVTKNEKGELDTEAIAKQAATNRTMLLMMPVMSIWIGYIMPAGIGIYWIANSFMSMIQDIILTKHYRKMYDAEDVIKAQKAAERAAIEEEKAKRLEEQRLLNTGTDRNPNTSRRKIQNQTKKPDAPKPVKPQQSNSLQASKKASKEDEPSRVGERRYARGRAYVDERFKNPDAAAFTPTAAEANSDVEINDDVVSSSELYDEATDSESIAESLGIEENEIGDWDDIQEDDIDAGEDVNKE